MASTHQDVNAALGRLTAQLQRQAAEPKQPRRRRGRPDRGIRREYVRLEVYIEPELHAALSQLAGRIEQRTGKSTRRSDVVRLVLRNYLR